MRHPGWPRTRAAWGLPARVGSLGPGEAGRLARRMTANPDPRPAETRAQSLAGLLLAAPAPSLGILAGLHWWPGPTGNALYMLGKGLLYLTPLIWWKLVMRGAPFPVKRPPRGTLRDGLLLGLGLGALIVVVYWIVARPLVDPSGLREAAAAGGFGDKTAYLWMAVMICGVNALLEEYAFRWFLYGRCRALLGPVPGAVLGALIFTAHHVFVLTRYVDTGLVVLGSVGVFVGGLLWTWLYERRDSVWPAYVSHIVVDIALLAIGWTILFP